MSAGENPFSLTRAASITGGAGKTKFLSVAYMGRNNSRFSFTCVALKKPFSINGSIRISFTNFLAVSLGILIPILAGCAGFRHGSTLANFQGIVVPVASKPGASRLQTEMDYDRTVQTYVSAQGQPDYIYVIDTRTVLLIYKKEGRVARFERPWHSPMSKVSVNEGIPPDLLERMK